MSISRIFQLLQQQAADGRDRPLPRNARQGRGSGLAAAIVQVQNSESSDDEDYSETSLAPRLVECPRLVVTQSTPFSRTSSSSSDSSSLQSDSPSMRPPIPVPSAEYLRKLCKPTEEPNRMECLLLPEKISIQGGRDHPHTGHVYFVNNTSKISEHLKRWHPRAAAELSLCEMHGKIESRINELLQLYQNEKKKVVPSRQRTIDSWTLSHRAESIRVSQSLMVLTSGHSFRSLDSIWWQEIFFHAGLDRKVSVDRKAFKSRYFPKILSVIKKKISSSLNCQSNPSITADCWSDRKLRSYLAITIHWIERENFQTRHALIDLYPLEDHHTSQYLSESIRNAIDQIANAKVTIQCAVGDGAKNSVGSLRDYVGDRNFFWCFAHRINLVVRHSLDGVSSKLEECRDLIKSIRSSSILRSKLRERTKRELTLDCTTRWNSTFDMLNRLNDLLVPLTELINGADPDFSCLNIPHWLSNNFLSGLTAILKPFAEISTLSQAESYPTLFAIPLWIRYLKRELEGFLAIIQESLGLTSNQLIHKTLAERLLSNMEHYFNEGENSVFRSDSLTMKALYLSCKITFLTPEDLQRIRENLIPEFRALKLHPSLEPLRTIFDDGFIHKVLIALQDALPENYPISIHQSEGSNVIHCESPFTWWRDIGIQSFPFIADLARVFLSIPATSAPSESTFSRAGMEDRANRSRLGSETLRSSLLVVRNAHFFEPTALVEEIVGEIVQSRQSSSQAQSRKRTFRPETSLSIQGDDDFLDRTSDDLDTRVPDLP